MVQEKKVFHRVSAPVVTIATSRIPFSPAGSEFHSRLPARRSKVTAPRTSPRCRSSLARSPITLMVKMRWSSSHRTRPLSQSRNRSWISLVVWYSCSEERLPASVETMLLWSHDTQNSFPLRWSTLMRHTAGEEGHIRAEEAFLEGISRRSRAGTWQRSWNQLRLDLGQTGALDVARAVDPVDPVPVPVQVEGQDAVLGGEDLPVGGLSVSELQQLDAGGRRVDKAEICRKQTAD